MHLFRAAVTRMDDVIEIVTLKKRVQELLEDQGYEADVIGYNVPKWRQQMGRVLDEHKQRRCNGMKYLREPCSHHVEVLFVAHLLQIPRGNLHLRQLGLQ
jgi:hypothetical protein